MSKILHQDIVGLPEYCEADFGHCLDEALNQINPAFDCWTNCDLITTEEQDWFNDLPPARYWDGTTYRSSWKQRELLNIGFNIYRKTKE